MNKFNLEDIFGGGVNKVELINFTRQFGVYYKSGVSIISAFDTFLKDVTNPVLAKTLATIKQDYLNGIKLYQSMAKFPRVFNKLYVNSIWAGETAGTLGEVLERLTALLEHELHLRREAFRSLRYPMIELIVIMGLMIFRAPLFFLNLFTWLILFLGIFYLLTRIKQVKLFWDFIKLKTPVFGPFIFQITISNFIWLFETLNQTGLLLNQSLSMIAKTIENSYLAFQIEKIAQAIMLGQNLTTAFAKSKIFPPLVMQLVSTGETAGKLDEMLKRVSDYYDAEVERKVKALPGTIKVVVSILLAVLAFVFITLVVPVC